VLDRGLWPCNGSGNLLGCWAPPAKNCTCLLMIR